MEEQGGWVLVGREGDEARCEIVESERINLLKFLKQKLKESGHWKALVLADQNDVRREL